MSDAAEAIDELPAQPVKDLYEIGEIPPLGHVPKNMYAWAIRRERHGEPDTAMLCYGRDRIYPTIHFERCREGAEDFYLYQTLDRLLSEQPAAPAAPRARTVLAELKEGVALNQRQPPVGYDPRRLKARVIAACEAFVVK